VLVNNAARGMRFVNERFMTEPRPFWEADPSRTAYPRSHVVRFRSAPAG